MSALLRNGTAETGMWAADAMVLTLPVPQSLAILQAGAVPLLEETRNRLERIDYERCLAVRAGAS